MGFLKIRAAYVEDEQQTHTKLNAAINNADPVKNTAAVTSTGNTTDETSANINSSGEIEVKDLGVTTAKLAADAVTGAKVADNTLDSEHYAAGSIDNEHIATGQVPGSGAHTGLSSKIQTASIGAADFAVDAVSGHTVYPAGDVPGDTDSVMAYDASGAVLAEMTLLKMSQHAAFPKAYGSVDFDSGQTTTINGGFNVASVTGTATTRTVNLTNAMASSTYTVVLSIESALSDFQTPVLVITDADTFVIHKTDEAVDPKVHFVVLGAQAGYSA